MSVKTKILLHWVVIAGMALTGLWLIFSYDPNPMIYAAVPTETAPVELTVEVGQLVSLTADNNNVVWFSEPTVEKVTYGAQNENCVLSFRRAGTYLIFSAAISDEVSVVIQRVEITVVGGTEPVVVTPARPSLDRLAALAGPNKAAVAASFRSVAAQLQTRLDAGILVTPAQIVALTAESNRRAVAGHEASWQAFFNELENYLASDVPKTVSDHIQVWNAIAAALEN